jgi:hypothetical protein
MACKMKNKLTDILQCYPSLKSGLWNLYHEEECWEFIIAKGLLIQFISQPLHLTFAISLEPHIMVHFMYLNVFWG